MIIPSPKDGTLPKIDPTAFVAKSATVVGNVEIGAYVNIWFGAVLRGDFGKIVIGPRTAIQDQAVIHTGIDKVLNIGADCIIAHGSIVHGPGVIGERCLIGMHATVSHGNEIGNDVVIGEAALVRGKIPDRSLVLGIPGRITRQITPEQMQKHLRNVNTYVENGKQFKARGLGDTF